MTDVKRWRLFMLLAVATLGGCADDHSPDPQGASGDAVLLGAAAAPETGAHSITQRELRASVGFLASDELEGRGTGQGGDIRAARWIAAELEAAGLTPDVGRSQLMQAFEVYGAPTYNVIGRLVGSDPDLSGEIVVVGAHFDHLGASDGVIHPGADDNASGTSLLIEVAEAMAEAGARRTVLFAAFGAEELGLLGSRGWVEERFRTRVPRFMVNADMVGHMATGNFAVRGVASDNPLGPVIRDACARHGAHEPFLMRNPGSGSDHVSFAQRGVPVAFFFTGLHADYHTPRDRADTLDYPGPTAVSRAVYETVWVLANSSDLSPVDEESYPFAPGEPAFDHGVAPFADATRTLFR